MMNILTGIFLREEKMGDSIDINSTEKNIKFYIWSEKNFDVKITIIIKT